jgi:hypothetical protein
VVGSSGIRKMLWSARRGLGLLLLQQEAQLALEVADLLEVLVYAREPDVGTRSSFWRLASTSSPICCEVIWSTCLASAWIEPGPTMRQRSPTYEAVVFPTTRPSVTAVLAMGLPGLMARGLSTLNSEMNF